MTSDNYIIEIRRKIEPLRQEIIHHRVYGAIKDLSHLRIFMQHHVYAVWDFMSLLKTLQNQLTCTTVPWFPTGTADTRYLINEIVVGEESDIDQQGIRKSHFELYLDAMQQCGANLSGISNFIQTLKKSGNFDEAFSVSDTPKEAKSFTEYTFKIVESGNAHLQAAVFTFGREDLIPGMFLSLVNDIHNTLPESISIFKYYLERHIEVDGDHHSHLALQMTSNLCGNDSKKWEEALQATIESLKQRILLWDGVYQAITHS